MRSRSGQAELTVADDGPGMAPARRVSALTRFEGDRTARKAGLGLAIVARLVAADNGTVALDETPGGGLTAVIRLPVAPTPGAADDDETDVSLRPVRQSRA